MRNVLRDTAHSQALIKTTLSGQGQLIFWGKKLGREQIKKPLR
jgi:hypothetical protein